MTRHQTFCNFLGGVLKISQFFDHSSTTGDLIMKISFKRLALAVAGASLLTLYGCGGGGGGTATVDVPVTVVDGAIENAIVCLDKNANGA